MKEFKLTPFETHIIEKTALSRDKLNKDSSPSEMNQYELTTEQIRAQANELLLGKELQEKCNDIAFELEQLEKEKAAVKRFLGIKTDNEFYSMKEKVLLEKETVENKKWLDLSSNFERIVQEMKDLKDEFQKLTSMSQN